MKEKHSTTKWKGLMFALLWTFSLGIFAQTITVRGTVSDNEGEPVIGATIAVQGIPGAGTVTNFNGEYTLGNVPANGSLVFSFVGMTTQTIPVNNRTTINVVMATDSELLDELVVVGYTVRRRESLVGSLTTVSGEQLRNVTNPSVENMLTSQVAGVYVSPGSGRAGETGAIIIRGQSSLHGSTAPLWVVDGVIVGNSAPQSLNPADIENVTVLKDASSTAIYGSQGANGVIVVTTRTPRVGKLSVSFSARMGLSTTDKGNFHMMNGAELYDLWSSFNNQEAINFPLYTPELRNQNFDWWDYATQTGVVQEYNISVSGGTDQLRSTFSVGMFDDTGIIKGRDWRRYNFQHRSIYRPNNWLIIRPTLTGARREIHSSEYSVSSMYLNFPWDSPFDADGNLVPHRPGNQVWVGGNRDNYLRDLKLNYTESTLHDLSGNLDFDIKLTDWLTFVSTNNLRWSNLSQHEITDPRTRAGEAIGGRIREFRRETQQRTTTQMLRANRIFNNVHELNALVAYEFQDFRTRTVDARATNFIAGGRILDITSTPEMTNGAMMEWAVQSLFTNWHYTYDRKYFLEFSLRRDGASNFGANNRYGNFYSVGGGWNVHSEEFFNSTVFNELRVRASHGTVGDRPEALYPSYSLYTLATASQYSGNPGALISQIGNRNITWETLNNTNIGVDIAVFNRARLSLEYYIRDNTNLLFPIPVPGVVGVTSIWQNVGDMRNTGFEATLGVDIIRNNDFYWVFNANIGVNKNTIRRLPGVRDADGNVPDQIVGSGLNLAGSGQRLWREGLDPTTWWLPLWAGVNPETGAPQWYRAENGVSTGEIVETIAQAGQGIAGTASPDFFGGFSTAFAWRQFDLGMVFGYSVGGEIINYPRLEYDSDGAYTDRNQMRPMSGWTRWEKPGDIATHPVATFGNRSGSNQMSSRWLEDASFLKMRSLTLGYNLALPQYGVSNIRISFTGENLFTLTNFSGVNPELAPVETTLSGAPMATSVVVGTAGPTLYPGARKFMLGVNLTF